MTRSIFLTLIIATITLVGLSDILEQEAFAEITEFRDGLTTISSKQTLEKNDTWRIFSDGYIIINENAQLTVKGNIEIHGGGGEIIIFPGSSFITDNGSIHNAGTITNGGTIRINQQQGGGKRKRTASARKGSRRTTRRKSSSRKTTRRSTRRRRR